MTGWTATVKVPPQKWKTKQSAVISKSMSYSWLNIENILHVESEVMFYLKAETIALNMLEFWEKDLSSSILQGLLWLILLFVFKSFNSMTLLIRALKLSECSQSSVIKPTSCSKTVPGSTWKAEAIVFSVVAPKLWNSLLSNIRSDHWSS